MKYLPLFYCMLGIAFAVRDKQLNLEDIEKDNLATERRSQQIPGPLPNQHIPQQYITPPQPITPPKLQYGFKPMKTQPQYTQEQQYAQQQRYTQQQQYTTAHQPQYTPSQQHFSFAPDQFNLQQYFTYQTAPQHQHQQQQQQQPQQQQHHQQQQYLAPSKAQQYVQSQTQYQQLELPYITDNHLAQGSQSFQQYYTPQYVYLQQYPAASNNIQTVVDPKGGLQYVMYLPSQYLQGGKAEQTQTVETLLQPQGPLFSPEITLGNALGGGEQQYQYIELPQSEVQPQVQIQPQVEVQPQVQLQQQVQVQPQSQKFVDIQYVQPPKVQHESPKYNFPQKYQPKSLLDSYVPSILQVQYYKQQQQQAQANAIRHSTKASQPVIGKSDFSKNYVPQAAAAPQSYNFQYASYASQPVKH